MLASVTTAWAAGDPLDRFGVVTDQGTVLAIVKGAATGLTNADLTRLIRNGVARAYPVQCDIPTEPTIIERHMVWRVTNDLRKPTAVITVNVFEGGKTFSSDFINAAAPGANPDAVFIQDVSRLARRVLPLAAKPMAPSSFGCS